MFWRARAPVILDVGPVLHPDDAVAGKMDALFNRWAPRDFLDVDTILASGRYTRQQMSVVAEHNPGVQRRNVRGVVDLPAPHSGPRIRCLRAWPAADRPNAARVQQLGGRPWHQALSRGDSRLWTLLKLRCDRREDRAVTMW